MRRPRLTPAFKEEAVRQITERGYFVAESGRFCTQPLQVAACCQT
jgi:transposase-like protein